MRFPQWVEQSSEELPTARYAEMQCSFHESNTPVADSLHINIYLDNLFAYKELKYNEIICRWLYIEIYARGVMVITEGNGHGDTSSNPGRD